MKKIKINQIGYENFKGIKSYNLNLEGENANISAMNAVGKTTLFDGFAWLLFGKDSAENGKFDVKPFDANGNEILGKEPAVEAELTINGEKITLRRELKEVWSTIKGRLEKERKSDKTKYFINGVPCNTQKEYTEFIGSIIDENIFKLLTNPFAFNALHWKEKREILLNLVDDVSIDEVIAANADLIGLKAILDNHTPDQQKAIVAAKMKEIKKDIDGLTVRFDEADRAIPDVEGLDKKKLEKQLQSLSDRYNELQTEAAEIKNGGSIGKLKAQIDEIKSKMNEGRIKYSQANQLMTNSMQEDLANLNGKYRAAEENLYECSTQIERLEKHMASEEERRTILLDQYRSEKAITFDEHRAICAMCGQDLPADQTEKMKTKFNAEKSDKLTRIIAEGNLIKDGLEVAAGQIEELKKSKMDYTEEVMKLKAHGQQVKAEIEAAQSKNGTYEETDEYQSFVSQGMDIQEKITSEQSGKEGLFETNMAHQKTIADEMMMVNDQLSLIGLATKQTARLAELKAQNKELMDTYNTLQGQEFLLDEFTRSRVQLLEEQINKQFKYANFKLFNLQKNGGIDEVCEATFEGIGYTNNLNNAARINVGLDIINTLSKKYEVAAPIFIDNAESVNKLIETESQMISLIVSNDPAFKVEVQR